MSQKTLLRTTVQQRIKAIAETWTDSLADAFYARFNILIATRFDILKMAHTTSRLDDEALIEEHIAWIEAYAAGFNEATEMIGRRLS